MLTELVIPKTLEDYVESRKVMINLYKQANGIIDLIKSEAESIGNLIFPYMCSLKLSEAEFIKDLDRRFWNLSFSNTGFMQLMDQQAKRDFDRSLDKEPPEFTIENIRSIFISLNQDSEMMFNRGVINAFQRFSDNHKTNTNNAFKINLKCIIGYIFRRCYSGTGLIINDHQSGLINDIDRVFKVLDKQKHIERHLEMAINDSLKKGNFYEDEYFKIKGYINGNAHIQFKREDLLEKVNDIIAKFYGENVLSRNH